MFKPFALAALVAPVAFALAAPAAAQEESSEEKVNMVIVYGDDSCPESTEDQITVCARKAETERFRIPENLRYSESGDNVAWAERVDKLEMVGNFGTLSCSPAGLGGFTGCTKQMIDAAYADKKNSTDIRFGQLVAEARAERLSTVDAEAAAEQERVEMIEKEYMDRLEKERAAPTPDESAQTTPPVTTAPQQPQR